MRNPFKKWGFKTKKPENAGQNNLIKEPWNSRPEESSGSQPNKTMIGRKADMPFLDRKDERSSFGSGYQCPECSYPLRLQVSTATPCPNCNFSGEKDIPAKGVSAKKTLDFHDLNFGKFSGERKFSLINEAVPDMSIRVDLEENPEVILNREVLDPENPTISGKGHILIKEVNGVWLVRDVSSNGTTFIQALKPQPLQDGARIILGSKIFLFTNGSSNTLPKESTGHKTMQFGQFNLANEQNYSFTLVDETKGTAKNFMGQQNELNRFNLDPEDQSLSGNVHAIIENEKGKWMIVDKSSNKATFVQASSEIILCDKIKIVLGNRVFRFEIG